MLMEENGKRRNKYNSNTYHDAFCHQALAFVTDFITRSTAAIRINAIGSAIHALFTKPAIM